MAVVGDVGAEAGGVVNVGAGGVGDGSAGSGVIGIDIMGGGGNEKGGANQGAGKEECRTNPFIDPNIAPAVHSIIHLLQLYGPLSYEQLKFNMVPQLVPLTKSAIPSSTTSSISAGYYGSGGGGKGGGGAAGTMSNTNDMRLLEEGSATSGAGNGSLVGMANTADEPTKLHSQPRRRRDKLQNVLDVLHELGIIHLVDKRKVKGELEVRTKPQSPPRRSVPMAIATASDEAKEEMKEEGKGPVDGSTAVASRTVEASKNAAEVRVEEQEFKSAAESIADNKKSTSSSSASVNELEEELYNDPNPIYCFGNGIPRMDVVQPSNILHEIREAGQEILRMNQRIEILRKALMVSTEENSANDSSIASQASSLVVGGSGIEVASAAATAAQNTTSAAKSASTADITSTALDSTLAPAAVAQTTTTSSAATVGIYPVPNSSPKRKPSPHQYASQVLRQLYQLHPEISNDPVYAAALRMFRVNVGTNIDHHKMMVENDHEIDIIRQTILNDGSSRYRLLNKPNSRKRSASTSDKSLRRSSSGDGLRGSSSSGIKKRKKAGRPPKNSSSSDNLNKSNADGGRDIGGGRR